MSITRHVCNDRCTPEQHANAPGVLILNVWDKSITGHDSEHRKLRAAITRAMDEGVTTPLIVHGRHGAAITPTPDRCGLWAVSASVTDGNGWRRDVPTFYLDTDVQGITGEDHARGIARDVIDPMHVLQCNITVARVS